MTEIYSANIRDIALYAVDLMKKIARAAPGRARKIRGYVKKEDRLRSFAAVLL